MVSPRNSARRDGEEHLLDPLSLFNSTCSSSSRSLLRGGDLEEGGSRGEGRGWLAKGRRGRGRGQWPKGWKGWGGGYNNWEERGSARVGEGGSHPSDRDQRPEHALPFELPTPAEKMPKDLLFP
jgi:hypothetical protein